MSTNYIANSIPLFISKLRVLVDDHDMNEYIAWDMTGDSFHIYDGNRLAKEVLPLHFKHNNINSFIRQLNMYGFRKINRTDNGGVFRMDIDEMEFSHPYFRRSREDLLCRITRKPKPTLMSTHMASFCGGVGATTGGTDRLAGRINTVSLQQHHRDNTVSRTEFVQLLDTVKHIKLRQETTDRLCNSLKLDNEQLYRDLADLRTKHDNQTQVIQTLFTFLTSYASESRSYLPSKRKLVLPLTELGEKLYNLHQISSTNGTNDSRAVVVAITNPKNGINNDSLSARTSSQCSTSANSFVVHSSTATPRKVARISIGGGSNVVQQQRTVVSNGVRVVGNGRLGNDGQSLPRSVVTLPSDGSSGPMQSEGEQMGVEAQNSVDNGDGNSIGGGIVDGLCEDFECTISNSSANFLQKPPTYTTSATQLPGKDTTTTTQPKPSLIKTIRLGSSFLGRKNNGSNPVAKVNGNQPGLKSKNTAPIVTSNLTSSRIKQEPMGEESGGTFDIVLNHEQLQQLSSLANTDTVTSGSGTTRRLVFDDMLFASGPVNHRNNSWESLVLRNVNNPEVITDSSRKRKFVGQEIVPVGMANRSSDHNFTLRLTQDCPISPFSLPSPLPSPTPADNPTSPSRFSLSSASPSGSPNFSTLPKPSAGLSHNPHVDYEEDDNEDEEDRCSMDLLNCEVETTDDDFINSLLSRSDSYERLSSIVRSESPLDLPTSIIHK